MNKEEYGEIRNGEETYKKIVSDLLDKKNIIIGWTDGKYDHRDIFLSLGNTNKYGTLQRGIKATDLFVGIVDFSFFGFKTDNTKHYTYILEKLRLIENDTNLKIAELINGVIEELKGSDN